MAEEKLDNWKQFQGTELGSLMSQLYGKQNRPAINYPKPNVKREFKPEKGFIPGGAAAGAEDPRKSTMRKDVKIAKPTFRRRTIDDECVVHPVDQIAHRRSENVIKVELDDMKMRQNYYRPAFTQPVSSEEEKERLSQICTYKGGKALPMNCVLPTGEAPFEMAAKARQENMALKHRLQRTGESAVKQAPKGVISAEEQLTIQICQEIDERREFLEEMKASGGLSAEREAAVRSEIAQRLREVKELNNR